MLPLRGLSVFRLVRLTCDLGWGRRGCGGFQFLILMQSWSRGVGGHNAWKLVSHGCVCVVCVWRGGHAWSLTGRILLVLCASGGGHRLRIGFVPPSTASYRTCSDSAVFGPSVLPSNRTWLKNYSVHAPAGRAPRTALVAGSPAAASMPRDAPRHAHRWDTRDAQ